MKTTQDKRSYSIISVKMIEEIELCKRWFYDDRNDYIKKYEVILNRLEDEKPIEHNR